jgi:hypothetical protein
MARPAVSSVIVPQPAKASAATKPRHTSVHRRARVAPRGPVPPSH